MASAHCEFAFVSACIEVPKFPGEDFAPARLLVERLEPAAK